VSVAEAKNRSRRAIELGHRLGAAYRARFEGRLVDVVWDRVVNGRIRGVSEQYLNVSAEPAGRRPGQLERLIYSVGAEAFSVGARLASP